MNTMASSRVNFSLTEKILGGVILIWLIFSRFFLLGSLPASLTHDEVVYAIQAQSYALQSTTLTGEHRPWDLIPVHPMYAELPATLMMLGFLVSNNALLATHFTSALMGVVLPFLLGWLSWGLWKNKTLSWLIVAISATNPLLWQFSRLSYDPWFSLFFYVAGGAVYVNLNEKKRWWSLPLFGLGFFQYQGFKLLLVPWIITIFLLDEVADHQFKNAKQFFHRLRQQIFSSRTGVIYATVLLSLLYGLILLPSQRTDSRLNKTVFSDPEAIGRYVDTDRRLSIPAKVVPIFLNKGALVGRFVAERTLSAFNLNMLFINGEPNASGFAVWGHGWFYVIDVLLIISAVIYFCGSTKRRLTGLLLLIALPAFTLPSSINTLSQWYLHRNLLTYTLLVLLIGWGAWYVWQYRRARFLLIIGYVLSAGYFAFVYFYRYPVLSLDAATFDERLIAAYAGRGIKIDPNTQVIIHTDTPEMTFYNYLLYQKLVTISYLDQIKSTAIANQSSEFKRYQLGNVTVTNECAKTTQKNTLAIVEINHSYCSPSDASAQSLSLTAVLDGGEIYRIFGDQLCQEYELSAYVPMVSRRQFTPETLDTRTFCQIWINRQLK